jgi:hypothetical protein
MRRIVVLGVVSLLAAACGGSGGASTAPSASIEASAPASPSASTAIASASTEPSPTPIPSCLPACVTPDLTRPGDLPAGDYTTRHWFGEQFTVTVPAGWTSFEDSTGEFGLRPSAREDAKVLFWLDVYPIVDGPMTPLEGYDGTAKSMIEWIEANPNVKLIKKTDAHIGDLEATSLEFGRSPNAVNKDEGCPVEIRPCVDLLKFPQWGDEFYGVAGPFHVRIIAADASWGGQDHAVYAVIDADDDDAFAALEPDATKMIEGARLPLGVGQEG